MQREQILTSSIVVGIVGVVIVLANTSLIPGLNEHVDQDQYSFVVPPGWTDLSPNVPLETLRNVDLEQVQKIRSGSAVFAAADLRNTDDDFIENVTVLIRELRAPVDDTLIVDISNQMSSEIQKVLPSSRYKPIKAELMEVSGVDCGRMVGELTIGELVVRQAAWYLPLYSNLAIATYSSTSKDFSHYESIFDASAKATVGLKNPPFFTFIPEGIRKILIYTLIGTVVGAAYGLFQRSKRRRDLSDQKPKSEE
jgi:hypothetical protein